MFSFSVADDRYHDLALYTASFQNWLDAKPAVVSAPTKAGLSSEGQMDAMRVLMEALYDEGWSRYGWPVDAGGLGGSIYHRALMWESLARRGLRRMGAFEHLEVLGPTLITMGPSHLVADVMPRFLDGTQTWAQGFSEPDAGSDLSSLRTRAVPTEGGYLITGRKIWTSWAGFATWCVLLARTGTIESRHRGITAFVVNLQSAGVDVRKIPQADGNDELSEVTFDDVFVPSDHIMGEYNGGWTVAMHILSHERGTFAWFRQCFLTNQLLTSRHLASPHADGLLADAILDLASVGAASMSLLGKHVEGAIGPESAFTKLLLCTAEQGLYDWILAVDDDLAVDPNAPGVLQRRQAYLFSRIVTIYGGSEQMQLETIAKQILRLP